MAVYPSSNKTLLSGEFYGVKRNSLGRWRAALAGARAGTRGPAEILWIGDSDAEGFTSDAKTGETLRDFRPAIHLINLLNGTLVPYEKSFDGIMGFNNGVGPASYDGKFTAGATMGTFTVSAGWALTGFYSTNTSGGAGVSTSNYGAFNCDGFKVWYVTSSAATNPSFAVSIDGGAQTNVNTNNAAAVGPIGSVTINAASYGSHTLNIVSKASTRAYLIAIEVIRTAPTNGLVSVGSAGMGATGTTQWVDNTNPNASPRACIAGVQPDLVIIGLGGNDQNGGMTAATFDTNMRLLVAASQTANADVVTMSAPANGLANPTLRFAYRDVFQGISRDLGTAHIDLSTRWGEPRDTADIAGFVATDLVHATKAGYADMAKAVAEVLIALDQAN